jgi:type VI secretion system protein ImpK
MNDNVAKVVYPVLAYGLNLREKLRQGKQLNIDTEQATLKGLLSVLPSAESERTGADVFLGIRYPLTCWIDELILSDGPWRDKWSERKLETALFRTTDRAWLFWEQAEKARTRAGTESLTVGDGLEVFFLCVMLGFRGQLRGTPGDIQAWVKSARAQIKRTQTGQAPTIPERGAPSTNVPVLTGKEKLHQMLVAAALVSLVCIPVLVFLVVRFAVSS